MKLSILIPSRNERFLSQTVADVLAKARGEIEIIVTLDGYWPDPPLPNDPRLHLIHRGKARGMRPGINAAAALAKGDYLLKLDGHCMVVEGFDVALTSELDALSQDVVMVPRRYRLDADAWAIKDDNRPPIDYHYLSYPFEREGDSTCGLHGAEWRDRARVRKDIPVDEEMSSQGSCWIMHRSQWGRIGPLDVANYGTFVQEFQEIGCKTWLGGGTVLVNKKTWYAHLHKGKEHGRGYTISVNDHRRGHEFCTRFWMLDEPWPGRKYPLRWLIERFWPVPTWPEDLDKAFADARTRLS